MLVGTHYETVELPEGFRQEKGTPIQLISTIGMLAIPRKRVIKHNYKLMVDLVAEVKVEDDKYVVVDYQIDEYGIGSSLQEAQQDLLDSLVDYLVSLERRENRLGDREQRNLQILRSILKR
jgi:hypothetical protein